MNDESAKIKQQIVDKIKSSTNILVTVNKNPSVDDLSAALGLTAMLNKLDKHATAIFSGVLPQAINFLEPDKVFESTADSLRDFIIALDKEKADHLRYKVEGDVVKIFITPYRANISNEDLEFSQGDYNIELVLALGVADQHQLDGALTANGGILENVTIATLSDGMSPSQLGSLDWNDKNAGSLSEMVAIISESLKTDKPLLDKQISTALLTGIVAATDRFSNIRTSSRVMSTAAQLMAAGANQQLISAKLQESHEISEIASNPANSMSMPDTLTADLVDLEPIVEQSTLPSDHFVIHHDDEEVTDISLPEPEEPIVDIINPETVVEIAPIDTAVDNLSDANVEIDRALNEPESPEINQFGAVDPALSIVGPAQVSMNPISDTSIEPTFGGTLSSTTEQAAEDAQRGLEEQQNKIVLAHSYLSGKPLNDKVEMNGAIEKDDSRMIDIFESDPNQTLPEMFESVNTIAPVVQPPTFDMPLPPDLPDFSTLSPPVQGFEPPSAVASFNAPLNPVSSDPSSFQIPGQ